MEIYDVIVIGSGLGGLETAALLSKKGYKTLVLEKNGQIGGALQSFLLNGCSFSAGMHYAGALGKGQPLGKFFSYMGIYDDIGLQKMDEEGYEHFFIREKEYRYAMEYDRFAEGLTLQFPREKKAVEAYTAKIKEVAEYQDIYNLRTPVNNNLFQNPYYKTGLWEYVTSITGNDNLRELLVVTNFTYAGNKETTPLYTHALILDHYLQGAYRFKKGSGHLARLLGDVIQKNGGKILTGSEAVSVTLTAKRLKKVELRGGETFFAENVISNVHPQKTLEFLDNSLLKPVFIKRIKGLENSPSVFSLFIKLKPDTLRYDNFNRHYFLDNTVWPADHYSEKWPAFFFVHHYVPPGGSRYSRCLSVVTYMNYEEAAVFERMSSGEGIKKYEQWKNEKSERLLNAVYANYPELKNAVESYSVATPLTFERYLGSPGGSMYGIKRDFRSPNRSMILPATRIPGFYFTGQNINLHGMMGVTLSTLVTLGFFTDINSLIKEINEAS